MPEKNIKNRKKISTKCVLIIIAAVLVVCIAAAVVSILSYNSRYTWITTDSGESIRISRAEKSVDLEGTEIAELSALLKIDDLQKLSLRGVQTDMSDLGQLTSLVELDLANTGFADVSLLTSLTSLKKLDMTGCELTTADYDALRAALPECEILWEVPFMGERLLNTTTALTLNDTATETDFASIKYFDNVVSIDGSACHQYDALLELWNTMPDCEVLWNYNLFGHQLNSFSTEVDLRGTMFSTPDDLLDQLKYLPSLTYCDMCGCGLKNTQMDILRAAYPDIKFVWYIQFAHWTVRTDITCFSTLNGYDGRMGNDVFDPLFEYCTDLVALDIGHHGLTDLEPIRNLKKLKYLILADNRFTDISPLADLTELVYLELFLNRSVKDLTPLNSLTNMVDLNLCHITVRDKYDFLYHMPNLKMVYLNLCSVPRSDYQKIYDDFPDVYMVLTLEQYSSTDCGWRETDRNRGLVYAFRAWETVKEFREWNDITYWEAGESSGTRKYGLRGYGYYETATGKTYHYSDRANEYKFADWYENKEYVKPKK